MSILLNLIIFQRHGSDSDLSLGGDLANPSSSKKDLSKRISGMFKRAGSRGNSVEKTLPPTTGSNNNGNGVSQQRPVSLPAATGSATQLNEKHLSKVGPPFFDKLST